MMVTILMLKWPCKKMPCNLYTFFVEGWLILWLDISKLLHLKYSSERIQTSKNQQNESSTLKFMMFNVKRKLFPIGLVGNIWEHYSKIFKQLEIFPKFDM